MWSFWAFVPFPYVFFHSLALSLSTAFPPSSTIEELYIYKRRKAKTYYIVHQSSKAEIDESRNKMIQTIPVGNNNTQVISARTIQRHAHAVVACAEQGTRQYSSLQHPEWRGEPTFLVFEAGLVAGLDAGLDRGLLAGAAA